MPITFDSEVESLIGTLPADQQAAWREKVGKGYLRQQDYSAKMNEAQRIREAAEEKARKNTEWWETTGEEKWRLAQARNEEIEAEAAELRRQVAAAASGGGREGTIDPVALDARVKAEIDRRGFIGKKETEELVKTVAAQTRKEAEEAAAASQGATAVWAQDMAYVRMKYEQEFGKPLDRGEFATFMTDNNLAGNPTVAMERYTAPERQKKEIEEREKTARADERDKVMKEVGNRVMPGSAGVGSGDSSPAVRLIRKEDTGGFVLPKGEKLGNGGAAAAAAARLIAAGKF